MVKMDVIWKGRFLKDTPRHELFKAFSWSILNSNFNFMDAVHVELLTRYSNENLTQRLKAIVELCFNETR